MPKMDLVITALKWFQDVATSWVGSSPHTHLHDHDPLEKRSFLTVFTSRQWWVSAYLSRFQSSVVGVSGLHGVVQLWKAS